MGTKISVALLLILEVFHRKVLFLDPALILFLRGKAPVPLPEVVAGTGVQGLSKTGIGGQTLPKAGLVTNPQLLPKGTTVKTGTDNTKVIRSINLGSTKSSTTSSTALGTTKGLGTTKTLNAVNPNLNKNATINRGAGFDPLFGNRSAQFEAIRFNWLGSTGSENGE